MCAPAAPRYSTHLHQAVLATSQMTRGIATAETSMTDASSRIATGVATTDATGATASHVA